MAGRRRHAGSCSEMVDTCGWWWRRDRRVRCLSGGRTDPRLPSIASLTAPRGRSLTWKGMMSMSTESSPLHPGAYPAHDSPDVARWQSRLPGCFSHFSKANVDCCIPVIVSFNEPLESQIDQCRRFDQKFARRHRISRCLRVDSRGTGKAHKKKEGSNSHYFHASQANCFARRCQSSAWGSGKLRLTVL